VVDSSGHAIGRVTRSNGGKEIGEEYTIKFQKRPKRKVLLLDKIQSKLVATNHNSWENFLEPHPRREFIIGKQRQQEEKSNQPICARTTNFVVAHFFSE
jgi:hypothetical protein